MRITERSPLSINAPINYISETDSISRWVSEAPDEKERSEIASKIKEACQTGTLILDIDVTRDITSLPPIPEGILSLEISRAPNLHSLPALPESLKSLDVFYCRSIDINNLPSSIENLNINTVRNISDIPDNVHYLSIVNCNTPVLPNELIKLKLNHCHGELIISDSLIKLQELEIYSCKGIAFHRFPSELEVINITQNRISLPDFPDDLSVLSLSWRGDGLTNMPVLPDQLKELSLSCEGFNDDQEAEEFIIPTTLPTTLSKITLKFDGDKKWDILAKNLPQGIKVYHGDVKINPECYKRQDVLFYHIYSESSLTFNPGDVLYGLSESRAPVRIIIEEMNGFNEKDIVLQNKLTNAVWDRRYYREFNSDEQIKKALNDSDRGIKFKEFLGKHKNYNITEDRFIRFTDSERWIKTSKAGLEFQTKVREKKVIFCVDKLIDSIKNIASKNGFFGQAISAHELRWLYRNRNDDKIKENVIFSLQGKIVPHETVFALKDWELYQPKSMKMASGE